MSRKRVAVLIASIDREYQQDFIAGLSSAGTDLDIDICILNSQGHMNVAVPTSESGESRIYDLATLSDFDGVISVPATMGNETALNKVYDVLENLEGKPHVSIDVVREGAVTILFDDKISVEEMTEHLIMEHGCRKIAFVSGPLNSNVAADRVDACRNALKKHGLRLDQRYLFDGEWTRVGGRRAAEQIIAMGGELPDAIMCGNDDMALSVIECFNEVGIRVPQDIAVTGFDAIRESVMRGLTTICRPIDKSARKALKILNDWIDGKEPDEKIIKLSTIPVFGGSCGCSQSTEHVNDKLRALGSERWNMETILTRVSMFSGMMAGVGDEDEAREKIHTLVRGWGISELYLCVDPVVCRSATERPVGHAAYPDHMLLLFGIRNNKLYEPKNFPVFDLTPGLQDIRKNPACLVFCPLYYRDRSFGYVAMSLGNATGSALYPVLMLLNGTLMSLYLQTNIKQSASTIERMANHDILTGMLNRRGYMQLAPQLLEQARTEGKLFVLLSGDMNHMKDINDRFGHLAGDEAICRMGRALRIVSEMGMIPVHISGDEFLAYGMAVSRQETESIIPMVLRELDRINNADPWLCRISVSLGIYADIPREGDDIDLFMTKADHAMYAEKNKLKFGRRKEDFEKEQRGQI